MKKIYCLLLSALSLGSCQKQEAATPDSTAAFEQPFALRYTQSARLASQTNPELTVKVADILDSRCPQDVTCFWAGVAQVVLDIQSHTGQQQTTTLTLNNNSIGPDSVVVHTNNRHYTIKLREVNPSPGKGLRKQDQVVTLLVKR